MITTLAAPAHLTSRLLPWLLLTLASGAAAESAPITGCWLSEAGNSVIELSLDSGALSGRIVGLERPRFLEGEAGGVAGTPRLDLNNPDAAQRSQALAGMQILSGLERSGRRWAGGTVYDPESGNRYQLRAELEDDGDLALRGFVGSPMFGRTSRWTRASADAPTVKAMLEGTRALLPSDAPAAACN